MKRSEENISRRKKFVALAVKHPKHAAAKLRMAALQIEAAKNEAEVLDIVAGLLCISERTLRYDLAIS